MWKSKLWRISEFMSAGAYIGIGLVIGGLLGFFFGWLKGRGRAAVPDSRLENELRQQVGQRETELTQIRAQLVETGNARAAAEARPRRFPPTAHRTGAAGERAGSDPVGARARQVPTTLVAAGKLARLAPARREPLPGWGRARPTSRPTAPTRPRP